MAGTISPPLVVGLDRLEQSLQDHFGWSTFRAGQRPVVEAVLAGRDALAVLPTGGGKSLCFQLPALIRNGLVVVISPLVALMEDQVMQLQRRGIAAACLHAGLNPERRLQAFQRLRDETLRLLYLAPERLQGEATRQMLESHASEGRLVALAVDEAHCISAWGHDFRPDYRRLGLIRRLCPGVPMLALSATAAPRVRADIIRLLDLRSPLVQVSSARRDNLLYTMRRRPKDPMPLVLEALDHSRGASLIYARTRRSVERWASRLVEVGVPATPYHAGLDPGDRQVALTGFLEQSRPVLVATVAFGMGWIGVMLVWSCIWICRPRQRGICRNPAVLAVMASRHPAWFCFRHPIGPVWVGRSRPPCGDLPPMTSGCVLIWPSSSFDEWRLWPKAPCAVSRPSCLPSGS